MLTSMMTRICKQIHGNKIFLTMMYWKMKISAIIEYASNVWSTNVSKELITEIDRLQIVYFKRCLNLRRHTHGNSILLEYQIQKSSIRIKLEKNKLIEKAKKNIKPKQLHILYRRRNLPMKIIKPVKNRNIKYGYENVNFKRYKYKKKNKTPYSSTIKYKDKDTWKNMKIRGKTAEQVIDNIHAWKIENKQKWYECGDMNIFNDSKFSRADDEENEYVKMIHV